MNIGTVWGAGPLNYPTTNSQWCAIDITGTPGNTSYVTMYQTLVFPVGARTVKWYLQNSGNWDVNSYFTASINGIAGASVTVIPTSVWVQYSLSFTVTTSGLYNLQFTTGVNNCVNQYTVGCIGCVTIT
jgi:hypothetical protein